MKILHLTNIGNESLLKGQSIKGDFGGGIASSLRDITKKLKEIHNTESIISCCYNCDFLSWAKKNDLTPVLIPGKNIKFLDRHLFIYLSIKKIREIIKKEKIDIIHAHYFPPALWGIVASCCLNIPIIVSIHQYKTNKKSFSKNYGIYFLRKTKNFILKILSLIPFYLCKRVIAVSVFVKESLINAGYKGRAINVVYNGINTDIYKPKKKNVSLRNELNLTQKHIIVTSIGRLNKTKGFIEIIQAAKQIKDKAPLVRFVFVGDGEEKKEYINLANKLNVSDIIFLLGFRNDTFSILQNSDIFLMPTYHPEGFSIVLLEALASGTTVLATTIGGNNEVLNNPNTGFVIEAKNPDNITQSLLKVIKNPDLMKSLSENGRKIVDKKFSLKFQCNELFKIYNSIKNNYL
jgi:glycosyltransferase involved in cell wall biosynthesis